MGANWTFTTSGAALSKAGANVDSTITASGAALDEWAGQAQGEIEVETTTDWHTNFSSLDTGIQNILSAISSSKIAKQMVSYNNTGYLPGEAQFILNMQDDIIRQNIAALEKIKNKSLEVKA